MLRNILFNNYYKIHQIQVRFKRTIDYSKVPELLERDISEKFIRGSGPGGSNTNKNSNCAFVRHIPTGIAVKCHETRYLVENRKRARIALIQKLDKLINKEDSIDQQIKRIQEKKSINKKSKSEKLRMLKCNWKLKENVD
ncbi:unnamed protein product [Brassicogethes aeneus]|uniref:Prokaryotic-type class I peptide chain release factors domain-containing protein n=1 Tax=Brassicogethes aeneus TaxID=1431903 RepID=A0A9P0FI68_BRAAE|nr:unnamed protein product [Brassicogethes aeneus]